jgi:hypothetical protein
MDLTRVLSDLRSELERIDQAILALERLDRSTSGTPPALGRGRTGPERTAQDDEVARN